MRWRSGLMGFSSIAKTPVSHGVEPHDLETVRTFAFVFSSLKLSASHRRNYRASGFVLTSTPDGYGRRVCAITGHSYAGWQWLNSTFACLQIGL
jgi:hypothetical protein